MKEAISKSKPLGYAITIVNSKIPSQPLDN